VAVIAIAIIMSDALLEACISHMRERVQSSTHSDIAPQRTATPESPSTTPGCAREAPGSSSERAKLPPPSR